MYEISYKICYILKYYYKEEKCISPSKFWVIYGENAVVRRTIQSWFRRCNSDKVHIYLILLKINYQYMTEKIDEILERYNIDKYSWDSSGI